MVLLTAPIEVLLERLRVRTTNPFGKAEEECAAVVRDHREVEPILRSTATTVIDTRAAPAAVLAELEGLIGPVEA